MVTVAVAATRQRNLFAAVMLFGIYSLRRRVSLW